MTTLQSAITIHQSGNLTHARNLYMAALQESPSHPDIFHLLGVTFYQTGDFGQAVALIGRAIELNPNNHSYHNNIGNALMGLGKAETAEQYYKNALALKPAYLDAINNLGAALHNLGKWDEEINLYKNGLTHFPGNGLLLNELVKTMRDACAWNGLDDYISQLTSLTRQSLKKQQPCPVSPYHCLSLPFSLGEQKQIAAAYVKEKNYHKLQPLYKQKDSCKKLRIGYISADFRDHPTAHLISGLFKYHNRERFEIFAYSTGKNDGSIFRQHIEENVDKFTDLLNMPDIAAAQRISEDGIDILIDVMGYIQNARPGIFAHRPARLQFSYLAYPGTTAAPYIDYIVTDKTVLPEDELQYFTEQPIYMPHTYFATNPEQAIASPPSRTECGLPEDAFVFCSFNKSNKIDSEVFSSWMKILKSIPGSVLWLFTGNEFTRNNLRQEAEKYSIKHDRLVFASRLPKDQHLGRHIHADLFLDCFNVCAHTTAIDALFAGVPVITKAGHNIITRASASILGAIGLAKLVAGNKEEYENMAINYASNPESLKSLKQELACNIKTKPLFDIKGYVKEFERHLEGITCAK